MEKQYDFIIGVDCSFAECIASGYMMVRYNESEPLEKQEFEFVQLWPEDFRKFQRENGIKNKKQVAHWSASELLEAYECHKEAYDSFADDLPHRKFDCICDFLALADVMEAYRNTIFE